jgi:hypothetical protein
MKQKVCKNEFCIGTAGKWCSLPLYQVLITGKKVNKAKNNTIQLNPS